MILKAGVRIVCGSRHGLGDLVAEVELPLWPGEIARRMTAQERKETYYHGFHDTPNALCRSCAWEQAI
jgi:hypothetical protein